MSLKKFEFERIAGICCRGNLLAEHGIDLSRNCLQHCVLQAMKRDRRSLHFAVHTEIR